MFGALLNYEQEGQTITLHYEKQIARIQVLTHKVINIFVPLTTSEHRSKAIEGSKELPTAFTLDKADDHLTLATDSLVCKFMTTLSSTFMIRKGLYFVLTIAVKESRVLNFRNPLSHLSSRKATTSMTPEAGIIRCSA